MATIVEHGISAPVSTPSHPRLVARGGEQNGTGMPLVDRGEEEYSALWREFYDEAFARCHGRGVAKALATARLTLLRAADAGRKPLGADDIESYF